MTRGERPVLRMYEANALIWLRRRAGAGATLAAVPEAVWEDLAARFDLVWLMGVWRRSAASRARALAHPGLRDEYAGALGEWAPADVGGSPYAIAAYEVDSALGTTADLRRVRDVLSRGGARLIVDFVPNHLAMDHPWTESHPERFVNAGRRDLEAHPDTFFETAGGRVLAHGRDPHHPPWTDTAQVSFFSRELRDALIRELLTIAEVADGVRCDMAMLALNDVFEGVWGWALHGVERPVAELWSEAITAVRSRHPEFLFIAEAYWGLEERLLELGFDFAYDKTLYDRLRSGTPADIRSHLETLGSERLGRGVHFIENHDEARAVTAFGPERARAAAVVVATLPGLVLVHDGQMEGRRIRLPVQLVREPEESADDELRAFYERLLAMAPSVCRGAFRLLEVEGLDEAGSGGEVLAWAWTDGEARAIVVVRHGGSTGAVRLRPPSGERWAGARFADRLRPDASLVAAGDAGLELSLGPWEYRVLQG